MKKTTDEFKNSIYEKQLLDRNMQLEQENAKLRVLVEWFQEQFRLGQHRRFGASSERTTPPPEQMSLLFNEVEATAEPSEPEPSIETITYKRRKPRKKRETTLEGLPVEVIEYRLEEGEQICDCCGGPLHEMSKEVRREIEIIPAQAKVKEHARYIYSCRQCEREEINTPIKIAPMPIPVIPKSLASPSALAYIITEKYTNGMPLYRLEQSFNRLGMDLSRQTMSNWVLTGTERWLNPVYEHLRKHLLKRDILQSDDTTLQVLQEPGRAPENKSYMWLYRTGRKGPHIVLFDYQLTRAREHPARFLEGFEGYLLADGYSGYNNIPGVILSGCWAHARRKFDEALKALPKSANKAHVIAREGLEYCNTLFAIERTLIDATTEERYNERLARSRPVLDAFLAWLNEQSPRVLPKSALGVAITYCKNQWDKLTTFLEDGRLEIDNNRSERSIKPFVIGRKNWLFANTPRGAKASAVCYSIVETAKENNLNPFTYLTYLFEKLPNIDIKDGDALDELLPWSSTLPDECRLHSNT
jgi:transposase